jgi:myo-inositol 2-dehydrogenase/D-chiro-inositol 1-dehydrogenase
MPVRVGFVGAGGIAGAHMNALEKVENAKIVAFADVDEARARKAADRFQATAYTDYKEMFAREDLQAVYVCVPPLAHTDAEILAAARGLALFVEKPVAINMAKAREINAAIQAAGVVSAVGYHWRNYETTDRVREELASRPIGMVMGYWMGGLPGVAWWRRMDGSGGQMVEQTTHIVDLARFLVGEIKTVYAAYALRALQDVESLDVPDVGTMVVHFETGAVGHIANTCLLKMGYTVGLTVVTPDLVVEQESGNVKLIRPHETTELRSRVNPTVVEDQLFIDAVESGDASKIRSPYADAVKSLAVSLAGNLSAERGEPVQVAEMLGVES